MIVFIAGTTAEFIKIAPVMLELDKRGISYQLWSTAQHVEGVDKTLRDLQVRTPDIFLVSRHGKETIARVSQVPGWILDVTWTCIKNFSELKNITRGGIVAVHGDTFTTVLGSILGRLTRAKVAHIEAGLRSGCWRSPFPEEINRRIVGRISQIHFAPTLREAGNLAKQAMRKGRKVIVTGANTVVDSLREARDKKTSNSPSLPDKFGLVTLHRFELVKERDQYEAALRKLREFSRTLPMVVIVGQSERARMDEYELSDVFDENFIPIDKLSYVNFQNILVKAQMVVTDSGGLQEECASLGIPCAVHRTHTERHQGIGENIVLTGLDLDILDEFLNNWEKYRVPSKLDEYHPSRIIVDEFEKLLTDAKKVTSR